jgi:N-acetylneuraminic acid mutarotase
MHFERWGLCSAVALAAIGLASCSRVGESPAPVTVSGMVSGLKGTGLVLADSGTDHLSVPSDGPFTFATMVPGGGAYSVSVLTQPASPSQTCAVAQGTGRAVTGDVTGVTVACTTNQYTVGGTVSGLGSGRSVGLKDNGGDNLTATADGAFTFVTKIASGSAYAVTVSTQPSGQSCTVTAGSGTMQANDINTVAVSCIKVWTWAGGANTADPEGNALGRYGTLGVGSTMNVPGERFGAISWTDNTGNLWLFGGSLLYSNGQLNDLWKYTPSTQQWTWVSGANAVNASGIYGTLGVGSATNSPGARYRPISWTDNSGDLWLFGGFFNDSTGAFGMFNDLWKYTPSSQQWTWVSGANTANSSGVYGTLGIGSTANVPPARELAISWTDSIGNLWLFGGAGPFGLLNDLWEYTPSSQQWTWVSGANTGNASGTYGTLGAGSTTNVPGARAGAISWTDAAGNLWLFGGQGFDSTGAGGNLNDLWEYTPSTQQWTWVSGANTANASGTYGTLGVGSTTTAPGARSGAISWTDTAGNLWLFGGSPDSNGFSLNDLWQYTPSTQQWTWVGGANATGSAGTYGTLGIGSTTNLPGARFWATSWTDHDGNLWLFGGQGNDSTGAFGLLGDLWRY